MTLLEVNKKILDGLAVFLNHIAEEDFTRPLDVYNGSSLGEHTRHIIEFYQCIIMQCGNGVVSYDLRERKREIQEHPLVALGALRQIIIDLPKLHLPTPIVLEVNPHSEADTVRSIATTVERELLYVLDHAIHHMALIKIGVNLSAPYVSLPPNFGVAPSTIRFKTALAG